ncbi:MAG TPA: c-type cytochrome [Bryobacteraceae bacterium]|nr:c-type cytochrome [Bryobacteraceae bacterium]
MTRTLTFVLLTASVCLAQDHGQGPRTSVEPVNPFTGQKQAIDAGERRFKQSCAACHGPEAEGGRGPNLAENPDLQTMSDGQLFHTIQQGIPGTAMPPSNLPDNDTWEVAAFLRSLNDPISENPVAGDPEAGRKLYYGAAHCSDCHAIRGQGGFLGSDLSNIGARMTAKQLRQAIINPDASPHIGFEPVSVTRKDGMEFKGVARNNSNYSIQIIDTKGHLHMFDKSDLKQIVFDDKSFMPDNYRQTLGPDGINNIMAFLAQQVARPGTKRPRPGQANK